MNTFYLDPNAAILLAPEVLVAMHPWLTREHGHASSLHLCNTSNVTFAQLESWLLLPWLDLLGIVALKGAAGSTTNDEPSQALLAMGRDEGKARLSLRFSFGRDTNQMELGRVVFGVATLIPEPWGQL